MASSFRLWSFAVGFSAVLAVSGCNCGNTQPGSPCSPGQTESCSCPGSAIGTQICGPDGGFGVCQCGTNDSGTPADAGGGHDSGTVGQDSGTPSDSGTGGQDSGVNNDAGSGQDSGTGGQDSGTPADSGTGGQDSGTPADSGTGGKDSGTTSDAGTGDAGTCGDGIINTGEQCDDGNLFNLDGCDNKCRYEMVTRMTSLQIAGNQAAVALGCQPATNAFGTTVITSTALPTLNQQLTTDINNGVLNILTQFLYLNDLTGVSNQTSGLSLGLYQASIDPAKGTFSSPNPIDWWFLADPTTLNNGLPTDLFTGGSLNTQALSFSSSDLTLTLNIAGTPATLEMLKAKLGMAINTTPAPNVPAPPPNALAAGITVFQTITGSGTAQGLCGNVTVESLAQIPIPQLLATGGMEACAVCANSNTYTYCGAGNPVGPNCNSLLDAIVGGCGVLPFGGTCAVHAINPSQPDVPVGVTVKPLTVDPTTHKVVQVTAGDKDGYSSYFTLNQNRAHLTGETCVLTSDCQTGKTCQAGVCK